MNRLAKTLMLTLIGSLCFGQTVVKIENLNELSNDVFEAIKPFPIIWIGEMHGANEPAEFAESIFNLLIKNNQKVTFGFEIKESDVPIQRDSISFVSSINAETYESRATLAWLNLILRMERNDKVKTVHINQCNLHFGRKRTYSI